MLDSLLKIVAPHLCYGCGKSDQALCDNCKYNIEIEPFGRCIACLGPVSGHGICGHHLAPYSRAWVVGERDHIIERLIDAYKFGRAKALHSTLADLLNVTLPQLPADTIVVPIPTISTHIRQRGYDHTLLIARELARQKSLDLKQLLARQHSVKQLGASRIERIEHAKTAFRLRAAVDPGATYLLVDDVYTTGATVHYGAKLLCDAGAHDVWVAVIARQTSTELS